ncbi:MAG: hypothetical protein P8N09_04345 [Planctomycetota bacterium]|nr:hypothetical protein [Planctomycetota bacterium]
MRALATLLLSLALFLPGCSGRDNYLTNRVADFSDIIRVQFMAGAGVGAKVEATRLLQLGFVYTHNNFAWGWANRRLGAWRESIRSWGLIVGHYSEEVGPPMDYYSGDYGWTFGENGVGFQTATGGLDLDLLTFRGTAMLFLGADLEVRLGEVIDFIAGIFQFDPAADDRDYENMRRREAIEAKADDADFNDDGSDDSDATEHESGDSDATEHESEKAPDKDSA